MSKIVYLLGAGASFGIRDKKKPTIVISGVKVDSGNPRIFPEYEYANIIEGLPLVSKITGRLSFLVNELKEYKDHGKKTEYIYTGMSFDRALDKLIEDLIWLKTESGNHATIDTFAKKLYLKNQRDDFYKVESLLSVFFILEQVLNKKDGRYDTFLASVLDAKLNIDDRIKILTWNYDSQFELAYKEYGDAKSKNTEWVRQKLGIKDLKVQDYDVNGTIFKLNGTANFLKQIDISQYSELNESLLNDIFISYFGDNNIQVKNSRVSFAWDNANYTTKIYKEALINAVKDAEVLVVIGYTFPFFNREIDREIFSYMTQLKKIYIQDPNAEQIISSLDSLYSAQHKGITKVNQNVKPITNTAQFYLPPEL